MIYFCPRSRGSQRQRSMLRRMRLTCATSVAGGARQSVLEVAILRVGRQQAAQHVGDAMLDQRRLHQRILPLAVEVLVDDVPAFAVLAADMAEGEVRRNEVEAVGRRLARSAPDRPSAARRSGPPGHSRRGSSPSRADLLDEAEQFLDIARMPHQRRQDHRLGRRHRCAPAAQLLAAWRAGLTAGRRSGRPALRRRRRPAPKPRQSASVASAENLSQNLKRVPMANPLLLQGNGLSADALMRSATHTQDE